MQQTLAAHTTVPTSGQFTTAPLTFATTLSTTTTSAPTAVPVPEDTSIEVLDLDGENQDYDPDVSLLLDSVEEISAPDIEVLHESRVTPNVQTTIDLKSSRGGRPGLSRNSAVKSRNARDGTERSRERFEDLWTRVNAPPIPVLGKVSLCFSLLAVFLTVSVLGKPGVVPDNDPDFKPPGHAIKPPKGANSPLTRASGNRVPSASTSGTTPTSNSGAQSEAERAAEERRLREFGEFVLVVSVFTDRFSCLVLFRRGRESKGVTTVGFLG